MMMKGRLVFAVFMAVIAVSMAQPFHGPTWDALDYKDKLSQLKVQLVKNPTSGPWRSMFESAELLIEDMNLTFDTPWDDFMPNKLRFFPYYTGITRIKAVHPVGAYVDVQWESLGNHNYTGILREGGRAICRLSLAGKPDISPSSPKIGAAIGLKFPRSNMSSTNLVSMYSLSGQTSLNFFEHDFTNHVPYPGTDASFIIKQGLNAFGTASEWPTMVGLSDLASFNQQGMPVRNPNFPFRLVFHPSTQYHLQFANFTPSSPDTVMSGIAKGLKPGTTMYTIYAQATPYNNTLDGPIGRLQIMDYATTSFFGDVTMFLQHVRMEADLALRPEWSAGTSAIIQYQASLPQYYFPDLPFQ